MYTRSNFLWRNTYFNLLGNLISGRNPCRDVLPQRSNVLGRFASTFQRFASTFQRFPSTFRRFAVNVPTFCLNVPTFCINVPTFSLNVPTFCLNVPTFASTFRRFASFCLILPHFCLRWGKMKQNIWFQDRPRAEDEPHNARLGNGVEFQTPGLKSKLHPETSTSSLQP